MPEELNRIVADHTSDFLFAPTQTAMKNLGNEGLQSKSILTGDIMVDTLQQNLQRAITTTFTFGTPENFYLLTLHRPYNVDSVSNLKEIFEKLSKVEKQIIFPIHPRTRNIIKNNNVKIPSNITEIVPQGYLNFLHLEYLSDKIITDSGGIQKEAYLLKKPCITLRTETEWIETVEDGWNILLDTKLPDLVEKISVFNPASSQKDVFGKNVTEKMVSKIDEFLR